MTDGLILAMLLCGLLTLLAYRMRSQAVGFIASVGWVISALQLWQQTHETFPMILMFMVALVVFIIVKKERD